MPAIREYTATAALKPDERGMQALGREAGAIGSQAQSQASLGESAAGSARADAAGLTAIGNALGTGISVIGQSYVKWKTNQEVSQGAAALAGIQADLTTHWNDTASHSDPNDQSIGPAFQEKTLEPTLQKFVEGFGTEEGQAWAQNQTASMRQHFYEKVAADQATRAGMAVAQNLDVLGNRAQSLVMQDPTALDAALGLIDNSIGAIVGSNPSLNAAAATKARTELSQEMKSKTVKAALVGAINANPSAGLNAIGSGKYADYLDGDTTKTLIGYAETVQRSQAEQARLDHSEELRQQADAAALAANSLVTSLVQPDGSLKMPQDYYLQAMKVAMMPNAPPGLGESLVNFGMSKAEALSKPVKIVTDAPTYLSFIERANLPDTDPHHLTMKEILDAATAHRLDEEDYQELARAIAKNPEEKKSAKDFHDYVESFKSAITSSTPLGMNQDALGDQMYSQFMTNAQRIQKAYKAQGRSEDDIRAAIRGSIPAFVVSKKTARLGAVAPNVLPAEGSWIVPKKAQLPGAPAPAKKETPEEILKRLGM